jgi:hypothetical protein
VGEKQALEMSFSLHEGAVHLKNLHVKSVSKSLSGLWFLRGFRFCLFACFFA